MKANIALLLILLVASFKLIAQTNSCILKIYGYSRSILGGAAQINAVEFGGREIPVEVRQKKEYYLYMKTCYVSSLTITGVWIDGNSYSAKAVKSKTPVVLRNTSLSTKGINESLVAKTSSPVWELVLSPDDTVLKQSTTMQKMIKANALVVSGILKGKKFTATLKSLKELQPLATQ
jgi:hypothetical protein